MHYFTHNPRIKTNTAKKIPKIDTYLHPFPGTELNPVQINTAEASSCYSLETWNIILIYVNIKHRKVTFNVMPLCIGLQYLLDGFIFYPVDDFGGTCCKVYYTLLAKCVNISHSEF